MDPMFCREATAIRDPVDRKYRRIISASRWNAHDRDGNIRFCLHSFPVLQTVQNGLRVRDYSGLRLRFVGRRAARRYSSTARLTSL
jgi:hypothetical protein